MPLECEETLKFLFDLWNTSTTRVTSWIEESTIITPIILSLIAALIFWIVFSYIPESSRRKKLRPVVELVIYDIHKKLFSLFDLILRESKNHPSMHQQEIRSGKLSESQISMGLQNKCLNETYLYDPNINASMLVIGRDVYEISREIETLADKIISFHTYATSEEIILFERIREKLRTYNPQTKDVERDSGSIIGGRTFRPINPTMSYRSENFIEIYRLFCELQEILLKNKSFDRPTLITKIQILYYSERFRECRKLTTYGKRIFSEDSMIFDNYLLQCEYKLGNKRKLYKIVEEVYKIKPNNGNLVSSRSILKDLLNDKKLIEILSKHYTDSEIEGLKKQVSSDISRKESFEQSNLRIKSYLKNKKSH